MLISEGPVGRATGPRPEAVMTLRFAYCPCDEAENCQGGLFPAVAGGRIERLDVFCD